VSVKLSCLFKRRGLKCPLGCPVSLRGVVTTRCVDKQLPELVLTWSSNPQTNNDSFPSRSCRKFSYSANKGDGGLLFFPALSVLVRVPVSARENRQEVSVIIRPYNGRVFSVEAGRHGPVHRSSCNFTSAQARGLNDGDGRAVVEAQPAAADRGRSRGPGGPGPTGTPDRLRGEVQHRLRGL